MTRAISTPLDAALAVLLITAAAVVLVGVHPPAAPAPAPGRVADTVLPVTVNATCAGRDTLVRSSLGSLLASAAADRTPPPCARTATERGLRTLVTPANITLVDGSRVVLRAGPTPRGPRVRADSLSLPGARNASVVVRTWSP